MVFIVFYSVLPPFLGKTLGRAFHVNTTVNLCRKPGIAQLDTEEQQLVTAPWGRAGIQNVSQAFSPNTRPTLVVALEIIPAFRDGNLFKSVCWRQNSWSVQQMGDVHTYSHVWAQRKLLGLLKWKCLWKFLTSVQRTKVHTEPKNKHQKGWNKTCRRAWQVSRTLHVECSWFR